MHRIGRIVNGYLFEVRDGEPVFAITCPLTHGGLCSETCAAFTITERTIHKTGGECIGCKPVVLCSGLGSIGNVIAWFDETDSTEM